MISLKKSVIFLINGLGIERPGSYSISIDQCMPNLSRTKETSFFTTALINSLEYKSAYQQFFLGDTSVTELQYLNNNVFNEQVTSNKTYQSLLQSVSKEEEKFHIFLEPDSDKIVEQLNNMVNIMELPVNKQIYLHLILTQQTTGDYDKLISTINYIKYHINERITVGFIMGKESLPEEITIDILTAMRKVLFYCSCERWSETDKKLISLKESNIRPCVVPTFCATNDCAITNGDTIMFFNTKRTNYDNIINCIVKNEPEVFKNAQVNLPFYSLVKLDSSYAIPFFIENVVYDNTLSAILTKAQKKALIITDEKNINYINFLANGYNHVNNPNVVFMKLDNRYFQTQEAVNKLINESDYDLIIFDYHMNVSRTVNDLKNQLGEIDKVLGFVVEACVNVNSLFITSLYGIRKEMPVADYNTEMVTIDYEMQIPIFFFDYSYPRSRYALYPGETDDILSSAIKCIREDLNIYSLVRPKGIINGILGGLKK